MMDVDGRGLRGRGGWNEKGLERMLSGCNRTTECGWRAKGRQKREDCGIERTWIRIGVWHVCSSGRARPATAIFDALCFTLGHWKNATKMSGTSFISFPR